MLVVDDLHARLNAGKAGEEEGGPPAQATSVTRMQILVPLPAPEVPQAAATAGGHPWNAPWSSDGARAASKRRHHNHRGAGAGARGTTVGGGDVAVLGSGVEALATLAQVGPGRYCPPLHRHPTGSLVH